MWLRANGFVDSVRQWWSSYWFQGPLNFILARKVKSLKADLRTWNEQVFGNMESKQKSLFEGVVCS
jgi:hypothetical protein